MNLKEALAKLESLGDDTGGRRAFNVKHAPGSAGKLKHFGVALAAGEPVRLDECSETSPL